MSIKVQQYQNWNIYLSSHSNSSQLWGCSHRRESLPRSEHAIPPGRLGFYPKDVWTIKKGSLTIFDEFLGPPETLLSCQMHWSKLCRLVSYFEEEPHWKGSAQSTTVSSNCIREIGNKVLIPRFLAAKNLGLWDSWDFNGDLTRIKVRKSLIFSSWLLTHSLRFHPYSFCFSTAIALFFILRGHLSYLIEDLTFDTCTQLFYIFDTDFSLWATCISFLCYLQRRSVGCSRLCAPIFSTLI